MSEHTTLTDDTSIDAVTSDLPTRYAFASVVTGRFEIDIGGRDRALDGAVHLNADGDRPVVQLDVRAEQPDFEAGVLVGLDPDAARELGERLFEAADDVQNRVRADGGRPPLLRFTGECGCGRRVVTAVRRPPQAMSFDPTTRARCRGCGSTVVVTGDPPGEQRAIADGGRDVQTFEVAEDRPAISYGPDPYRDAAWTLAATTGEERVELLLGEQAMYQLWTEVQNVPRPRFDDENGRLVRQLVHLANGADESMLRDALAVLGDRDHREREPRADGGDYPVPDVLDVVDAPEGAVCQMYGRGEEPERCHDDAENLVVYDRRVGSDEVVPANVLACPQCWRNPGRDLATDGGTHDALQALANADDRALQALADAEGLDPETLDDADRERVVAMCDRLDALESDLSERVRESAQRVRDAIRESEGDRDAE